MRLLLLFAALLSLPAHASDELLARILQRLAESPVIRAEFLQERQIADMARPSLSSGRITVSRSQGVLWRIESPLRVLVAFTPSEIIETGPDGVRRLRSERRGAVEAEMGRLMRAILGGDAEALRANFELRASGDLSRWRIRLVPRAREMARFLKEIRLGGARFLESIEIEETSGNQTVVRMRGFSVAAELDPFEQEQFRKP
jgi:hypothetical protein